jgi:hypothetical protein
MARLPKLDRQARVKHTGLINALREGNEELIVTRARNLLLCGPGEGTKKEAWLRHVLGDDADRVIELLHAAYGHTDSGEELSQEDLKEEPRWQGRRHDPRRSRGRRRQSIH